MAPQTAPTINLVRNDDLPPEDEIQHEEAWDHEPCGCRHCVGYHYDFWTVVDSPSVSVSIVQGLRAALSAFDDPTSGFSSTKLIITTSVFGCGPSLNLLPVVEAFQQSGLSQHDFKKKHESPYQS